jgi:hypothetical protein
MDRSHREGRSRKRPGTSIDPPPVTISMLATCRTGLIVSRGVLCEHTAVHASVGMQVEAVSDPYMCVQVAYGSALDLRWRG